MTDIVKTFLPTKLGLTSPDLGHHLIVCKVIRTRNSGTPWLVGNSPVVGGGPAARADGARPAPGAGKRTLRGEEG